MAGFIDTHAHIYLDEFKEDLDTVVERARLAGLTAVYMPNIDSSTINEMMAVAEQFKGFCYPMMGLHPCSVKENFEDELKTIEDKLASGKFKAVGEMGTDLYWEKKFWDQQKEVFSIQIDWAKKHSLPVVIHCRETLDQTISMVEEMKDDRLSGVFHCFTGTVDQARRIQGLGFYMGFGGVSTFKNGGLDKVLPFIDLDFIVLETDSPYLAPVPYRGKRNEPSYIPGIAGKIAEICGSTVDEIATKTTINANKLFGQ